MTAVPRRAAIVLAGGRARRLGGADKAGVEIGGRTLLDRVLDSVASCRPAIVVGPPHLSREGVTMVREQPPFGGPVAAIAAAIPALPEDVEETWLLACDLPRAFAIMDLLSARVIPEHADALVLRDADGRSQPLAGRYRIAALRAAVRALGTVEGASMRQLVGPLRIHEVDDPHGAAIDLDTWEDVAAFREGAGSEPAGLRAG